MIILQIQNKIISLHQNKVLYSQKDKELVERQVSAAAATECSSRKVMRVEGVLSPFEARIKMALERGDERKPSINRTVQALGIRPRAFLFYILSYHSPKFSHILVLLPFPFRTVCMVGCI